MTSEDEKIVRLVDGKLSGHRKHQRQDAFGNSIPVLNKKVLSILKPNLINISTLDGQYEHFKRQIAQTENPRRRKRMELKLAGIQSNILTIKRQKHWLRENWYSGEMEFMSYIAAYRGSFAGRLYEIGGGMQSIPREFKRAAYFGINNLANYDLRAAHISIIAQYCREAGHPLPILEEYVKNSKAKKDWAKKAGLDDRVDLWKECLISLIYGAALGKCKKSSIFKKVWYWYDDNDLPYTEQDIVTTYENFVKTAAPFIEARKVWLGVLKDKIIPSHTHKKAGQKILRNQCGAEIALPEQLTPSKLRTLSAFFCQGMESAFICHLALLGNEQLFDVRSLEHDGLIVSFKWNVIDFIPTQAIEKAKDNSGFYEAILEEKKF